MPDALPSRQYAPLETDLLPTPAQSTLQRPSQSTRSQLSGLRARALPARASWVPLFGNGHGVWLTSFSSCLWNRTLKPEPLFSSTPLSGLSLCHPSSGDLAHSLPRSTWNAAPALARLPSGRATFGLVPDALQRPCPNGTPAPLGSILSSAALTALPVTHLVLSCQQPSRCPALTPGQQSRHDRDSHCRTHGASAGTTARPIYQRRREAEHQARTRGQRAHIPLYRPAGYYTG